MRTAAAVAVLLCAAACARAPEESGWTLGGPYSLPKDEPGRVAKRDLPRLVADTVALNERLGIYPARFSSQTERDASYRDWSDVLLDARLVARPADGVEARMWVLGELYRLGHNLRLRGAAELADDHLSACVAQVPASMSCHASLVALYLSVKPTPERLARVESSLVALHRSGQVDEFVAAEYVHLRVVERDTPGAQLAIDEYLDRYPEGPMAPSFRKLRARLDESPLPPVSTEGP